MQAFYFQSILADRGRSECQVARTVVICLSVVSFDTNIKHMAEALNTKQNKCHHNYNCISGPPDHQHCMPHEKCVSAVRGKIRSANIAGTDRDVDISYLGNRIILYLDVE